MHAHEQRQLSHRRGSIPSSIKCTAGDRLQTVRGYGFWMIEPGVIRIPAFHVNCNPFSSVNTGSWRNYAAGLWTLSGRGYSGATACPPPGSSSRPLISPVQPPLSGPSPYTPPEAPSSHSSPAYLYARRYGTRRTGRMRPPHPRSSFDLSTPTGIERRCLLRNTAPPTEPQQIEGISTRSTTCRINSRGGSLIPRPRSR